MHRVHFRKENVTIHVADGTNLRKACLEHDVDPYPMLGGKLSCRGKGFCGTCAVLVDDVDAVTPAGKRESGFLKRMRATHESVPDGFRLSCQCAVMGDVIVDTDPDLAPAWKRHGYYSGRPVRSWEPSKSDA